MLTQEINTLLRLQRRFRPSHTISGFRKQPVHCVAKTGQTIRFSHHDEVEGQLTVLMARFLKVLEKSHDHQTLCQAFSFFWLGFVAIHPFIDGNGRTGKAYIEMKAFELGYDIDVSGLDKILLVGKTAHDLNNLQTFFLSTLQRKAV